MTEHMQKALSLIPESIDSLMIPARYDIFGCYLGHSLQCAEFLPDSVPEFTFGMSRGSFGLFRIKLGASVCKATHPIGNSSVPPA